MVTKIVQRNFSANALPSLFILAFLFIPKCLRTINRSYQDSVLREWSTIILWNNSWIITAILTIILNTVWLLPEWTAYTVHSASFFKYQIHCLPVLPCHFITLKNVYYYSLSTCFPRDLLPDDWGAAMNQS